MITMWAIKNRHVMAKFIIISIGHDDTVLIGELRPLSQLENFKTDLLKLKYRVVFYL